MNMSLAERMIAFLRYGMKAWRGVKAERRRLCNSYIGGIYINLSDIYFRKCFGSDRKAQIGFPSLPRNDVWWTLPMQFTTWETVPRISPKVEVQVEKWNEKVNTGEWREGNMNAVIYWAVGNQFWGKPDNRNSERSQTLEKNCWKTMINAERRDSTTLNWSGAH